MLIFSIISIFGLAKQCAISHILRAISHTFPTHQQTKTRKRTGHIRTTFQRLTLLSNEVYRIVRPAKAALGDQQKPLLRAGKAVLPSRRSRSSKQEKPALVRPLERFVKYLIICYLHLGGFYLQKKEKKQTES